MAVPRAVKKQGEAADKAVEELKKQQNLGIEKEDEPEKKEEPEGKEAAPENPEKKDDGAPESPESKEQQTPEPKKGENYESMYKALKGKYDREVPTMMSKVRDLEATVRTLKQEKPEKKDETPEDYEAKLIEEFGSDAVNLMRQLARAESGQSVKEVSQKVDSLSEKTESTNKESYFGTLSQLVPDWETLNTDTDFLAWLEESDGLSGTTRGENLEQLHNSRNAKGVAAYFQAFKESQNKGGNQTDLSDQILPETGGGGDDPEPAQKPKRKYTAQEVKTLYTAMATGQGEFRNNPEKVAETKRELEEAAKEGRITS